MESERPAQPKAKVAGDLFELENRNFLATVHYWSNYIQIDQLTTLMSAAVIKCLKWHFATHGIPKQLVTDNGPQFSSDEFKRFSLRTGSLTS